jgi:hypothetical protein
VQRQASKIGSDLPMAMKIRFRTNNIDDELGGTILLQLFEPAANVLKGGCIGDIVEKQGGVSTSIIHRRHASESLLTGSVPQLQANLEAIHVDLLRYEESAAGGGGVLGVELVLRVTMEETSLSDPCYIASKRPKEGWQTE